MSSELHAAMVVGLRDTGLKAPSRTERMVEVTLLVPQSEAAGIELGADVTWQLVSDAG